MLVVRDEEDDAARAGVVAEAEDPPAFLTRSASRSAYVSRSMKTVSVLACSAPTSILTRTSKRLNEPVFRVMFSTYDAENSPCQVADEESSSRSTKRTGSRGADEGEEEEEEEEEEELLLKSDGEFPWDTVMVKLYPMP